MYIKNFKILFIRKQLKVHKFYNVILIMLEDPILDLYRTNFGLNWTVGQFFSQCYITLANLVSRFLTPDRILSLSFSLFVSHFLSLSLTFSP